MALRTAPCPRCRNVVVFGERACRSCAQVFEYGAGGPPPPTPQQVWQALYEAGVVTAEQAAAVGVVLDLPVDLTAELAPLAPHLSDPAPAPSSVLEGLETGRFAPSQAGPGEAVPGLIDSTLFAAYTPRHVDVEAVPGLEVNRFAPVQVHVAPSDVVEATALVRGQLPDVPTHDVPGLFGSDMFRAGVEIAAGADRASELDVLPSARRVGRSGATRARPAGDDELRALNCTNCGAWHKRARCPACGTAHPDATG